MTAARLKRNVLPNRRCGWIIDQSNGVGGEMPRSNIGGHSGFRSGQLHQLEAATLVLRAGRAAGMVVRTEHRLHVVSPSGKHKAGEIDIVWFHPKSNRLLVAWEIDGHDASDIHIRGGGPKDLVGNKAKLRAVNASKKIQVLYSLCNDLSSKGRSRRAEIAASLAGVADVVTDEELMGSSTNNIDSWMEMAGQMPT